jgi:hypothetical protein
MAPDAVPPGRGTQAVACRLVHLDIDRALPPVAAELDLERDLVTGVQPAARDADEHVAGAGIVVARTMKPKSLVSEKNFTVP